MRLPAVRLVLAGGALALLGACGDQDPLTIRVADRVVYSEAPAPAAGAVATPGAAPAAAPAAGGGFGIRMPALTSNVPVFIGDRQVSGPGMPGETSAPAAP